MAISIKTLNNGKPLSNPYGKVTAIPSSFTGLEYYDCYIPYSLTNKQLGGYKTTETVDPTPGQQATYNPMSEAIKGMRVANYINLEERYNYPNNIQAAITSGRITRHYDSSMHCHYLQKDGIKFYEMAVQPFFLRRSVGTGDPSNTAGYYKYTDENRGQLIDVILTSGKCIHFVLADINSTAHTNCGYASHNNAHDGFASTPYLQYHNIISAIAGNTIEILGEGEQAWGQSIENYANRKFARKYLLGVWGQNGSSDIAFYRVYHHRIQDESTLTAAETRMKSIDYDIVASSLSGSGSGSSSSSTSIAPVIEEPKGIKGLVVNFDIWKNGTHLIRVGDNVILKALKQSNGSVIWQDITDKAHPVKYSPLQLKSKYGISYTSVNDGYVGKFEVKQKPLAVELGGTGVRTVQEYRAALLGTNDAPGGYDYEGATIPTQDTSKTITPPALLTGHITTAEARSALRGGLGSNAIGDQAQAKKTKYYDDQGEVSIIYDRSPADFTNLYRLVGGNAKQSATCKIIALSAANHAWFLANNSNFGYNFYDKGTEAVWNYISAVKQAHGYVNFGQFANTSDTNCINFCRLVYAASFPWDNKVTIALFNQHWTTDGILKSNILETLGFKKYGNAYAKNPSNHEIGDILIKSGHAALVVDVGGKSWNIVNTNFSPANGEVKT